MPPIKQIVCLANSRKLAGRCIAGKTWDAEHGAGEWIRPVSGRDGGAVSEHERQYPDGSDPRVLDVVRVPVTKCLPEGPQTENWHLDTQHYWEKAGRYPRWSLDLLVDKPTALWANGWHTYRGRNDYVPMEKTKDITTSLRLIRVERLVLEVFAPGEAFGSPKRRVQGWFSHAGSDYKLWVTDPLWELKYLSKLDGSYAIGECFLTISLGEPFRDAVYKLIAAVIALDEGSGRAAE